MFQEETECLKAQLDSIQKEDEKLAVTPKVFSVKEELVTQQCNIKKEVSNAQSFTPPPSDRCIVTRAAGIKRKIPKMQLTI